MKTGDIILIPFPFSDHTKIKVRPAVVITETEDKFKDYVVSAISSVVPLIISKREFIIRKNSVNKLRSDSVVKADRIVTIKRENKIAALGKLSILELQQFKTILHEMVS